ANLPPMLRKAVHGHPELAHRALAMQLGLNYEKIQASMEGEPVVDRLEPEITGDEKTVPSQGRKRRRQKLPRLKRHPLYKKGRNLFHAALEERPQDSQRTYLLQRYPM
ncbi:MAG: hypothetical protein Q9180_007838, partial [Flavoplaca navasiana]